MCACTQQLRVPSYVDRAQRHKVTTLETRKSFMKQLVMCHPGFTKYLELGVSVRPSVPPSVRPFVRLSSFVQKNVHQITPMSGEFTSTRTTYYCLVCFLNSQARSFFRCTKSDLSLTKMKTAFVRSLYYLNRPKTSKTHRSDDLFINAAIM